MRDKSIEDGKGKRQSKSPTNPPNATPTRLLQGGHDPREMGRRGGRARAASLSAGELSEIGRNAQLARTLKHKRQLNNLVGPAIKALDNAIKSKDQNATIRAAIAVMDRNGFGPKSTIEIEGEISGELIHRHQLLPTDRLPLIIRLMMAAAIELEWEPSPELAARIKLELPMLEVKVESSKPARSITDGNGNGTTNGNAISAGNGNAAAASIGRSINRAITAGALGTAAYHDQHQDDATDDATGDLDQEDDT